MCAAALGSCSQLYVCSPQLHCLPLPSRPTDCSEGLDTCVVCGDGYGLVAGKCVKCEDDQCQTCGGDAKVRGREAGRHATRRHPMWLAIGGTPALSVGAAPTALPALPATPTEVYRLHVGGWQLDWSRPEDGCLRGLPCEVLLLPRRRLAMRLLVRLCLCLHDRGKPAEWAPACLHRMKCCIPFNHSAAARTVMVGMRPRALLRASHALSMPPAAPSPRAAWSSMPAPLAWSPRTAAASRGEFRALQAACATGPRGMQSPLCQ